MLKTKSVSSIHTCACAYAQVSIKDDPGKNSPIKFFPCKHPHFFATKTPAPQIFFFLFQNLSLPIRTPKYLCMYGFKNKFQDFQAICVAFKGPKNNFLSGCEPVYSKFQFSNWTNVYKPSQSNLLIQTQNCTSLKMNSIEEPAVQDHPMENEEDELTDEDIEDLLDFPSVRHSQIAFIYIL